MRQFVITNPNLSVGRPGDVVEASQLNMSDDKLDEWVDAGYAMELHDGGGMFAFDPDDHTVAAVLAHIAEYPDDAMRVITLETKGKNRSGIVTLDVDW